MTRRCFIQIRWAKTFPALVFALLATSTLAQNSGAVRAHWSFQPVKRPAAPAGPNAIDALVTRELHNKGLTLSPSATPRQLIRRAYFDLIGLPPTPEEVKAFEANPSSDRYEKLIDDLLARPQYGERWGRHWLDVARFAQSNGYERDGEKPLAWRYRDYVIKAFNDDKPYHRFVMEQIAGDELPDANPDSVAATGFQRLGVFDDEPDDKRAAEFDALDDILSTTGAAFLGLTIGCARCHEHKFDPIAAADYYALLAFFRGVRPYENKRDSFDAPGFAPLATPGEVKRWLAERDSALKPLEAQLSTTTDEAEKKRLQEQIKNLKERDPFEWTLAVREAGSTPPTTHVLLRGNAATPGAEVEPAFLPILGGGKPSLHSAADAVSSGRRLALAQWVASAENPLTARVMVNRIWQHHFGRALVKTTTDFGRAGAAPTHPELLDWLAAEFVDSGWSMKKLHRLIMLSQTYRQSSRAENERARTVDPDNALLWRQNLHRLEAEAVRDTALAIAGSLNPQMGGRGFFPHLSGEVLAGQSRPGLDWEVSSEAEQSRRSVYAFVRRTMAVPLLECFDYSNTTSPLAERATTTVAPQALMLLNDDFLQRQATAFAERLTREASQDQRIQRAYQLALNRDPTSRELDLAAALIRRQTASFAALSSRISFRPDVASALATEYFNKLQPEQFVIGPRTGWSYHRGFWAPPYEGIRVVERARGPVALWQGANFTDGVIEAKISLASSTELAGLLFRASAKDDLVHGYEVVLNPREQRIVLQRHNADLATLATAPVTIPIGTPLSIRIETMGSRVRVWLANEPMPVVDARDEQPLAEAGRIGVRTWGGALNLDDLAVRVGSNEGGQQLKVPAENAAPERRALESFCLLMLNLNEVIYVD